MRDQDHPRVAKLNISSRYLVDKIDGESFRLFCPPFADELVWHQASKRRQPAGVNRICRLYRAEGLPMRKREANRRAVGTHAQTLVEAKVTARWPPNFVYDQCACGRRLRVLNVVDNVARELAKLVGDGASQA